MDLMDSTKCVICLNDCSPQPKVEHCDEEINDKNPADFETTKNCQSLKKQLQVIFLLRRFLEVPENICCKFLQEYGDPWMWTTCCSTCSVLVAKAKYIYDKIASLQREYETLQAAVRMSVVKSVSSDGNLDSCISAASQKVRFYINLVSNIELENNEENEMNWPSAASDCEASDGFDDNDNLTPGFDCSVCDKVFKSALLLKYHERTHKKDKTNWSTQRKMPSPRRTAVRKEIKVTTEEISDTPRMETHNENIKLKPKPKRPPERYTCSVCGKITTRSVNHERHMATHDESKLRNCMCPVCNEMFANTRDLSKHLRANHEGVKPFKCPTCGNGFTDTSDLRKHIKRHTGKNYACSFCPEKFLVPNELKRHMRRHTGERPFKCDQCPQVFTQKGSRNDHVKRVHIGDRQYACSICDRTFATKTDWRNHEIRHTGVRPFMCEVCGKSFALRRDVVKHTRRHKEKVAKSKVAVMYTCEICGKLIKSKGGFNKHLLTHKERPFICDVCGKGFIRAYVLRRHAMKHTQVKAFQCEECGRSFTEAGSLSLHKKHIHEGERPHQCQYCEKKYVKPRDLRSHIISVHTEEGRRLKDHKKNDDKPKKISAPKTFSTKCEFCDTEFDRFIDYKNHRRKHTGAGPNTCDFCEESFLDEKALLKHIRKMHKKCKNFECEICGKRFGQTKNLNDHVNTHTGNRPYTCDFENCDAHFAQDRNLQSHRKTHERKKDVYIIPPKKY